MRGFRPLGLIAGLFAAMLAAGCSREGPPTPKGRLTVGVSVAPLGDLARRVGGDGVNVLVLVTAGQEPHTYEPLPRQMGEFAQADLYFSIDLPVERRLVEKIRAVNRRLKVVDIREGIRLRTMTEEEQAAHTHEESGGAHTHEAGRDHGAGEPDPHVWMSPRNAKLLCANMAKAMSAADPAHAADYARNLAAFTAQLDEVDRQIAAALAPYKGREFMTYHPAFGYFADAYGLKELPVEIEGKEPAPRQLTELVKLAKERDIRIVFVQPQFSDRSAKAVAEAIGGTVLKMDDLAPDYLQNLRDVAAGVQSAVGREKP